MQVHPPGRSPPSTLARRGGVVAALTLLLARGARAEPLPECPDWDPPLASAADVDETCVATPQVGSFDPVVRWQWPAAGAAVPTRHRVMTTPVVGNLTDDDGDGLIDDRDDPDVLAVVYGDGGAYSAASVVILDGATGAELDTWEDLTSWNITGLAGAAIGDLGGDGRPEVCLAAGSGAAVVCFDAGGAFLWQAGTPTGYGAGYPTLGDMNGDGRSEVGIGAQIFDWDGTPLGTGALGRADRGFGALSVMADMDADGLLDLVAGSVAYHRDGSVAWGGPGGDGYPAVGDLDGNGLPDVVRTGDGSVSVRWDDGRDGWSVSVPGGGAGGPPTIADFDGDGAPEIGVAGAQYYAVLEADGAELWKAPIRDVTSNVTGSSVFDFEGDGRAEVVYADEKDLWVLSGVDGSVRLRVEEHESGTWFEYPVLADLDNDGSTEIVLGSNDYFREEGWVGITAIADANASWMASRPIWNQHGYHISNVEDDGGVPVAERPHWRLWNSFRAADLVSGPSAWLADLRPTAWSACDAGCLDASDTTEVWVTVENSGPGAATDVVVNLVREDGVVIGTGLLATAAPGAATPVGITVRTADWEFYLVDAVVDPEGLTRTCHGPAPSLRIGTWPMPENDPCGDGHVDDDNDQEVEQRECGCGNRKERSEGVTAAALTLLGASRLRRRRA